MAIEKLETFLNRNNVKFDSNLKDRIAIDLDLVVLFQLVGNLPFHG